MLQQRRGQEEKAALRSLTSFLPPYVFAAVAGRKIIKLSPTSPQTRKHRHSKKGIFLVATTLTFNTLEFPVKSDPVKMQPFVLNA